MTGGLGGVMEAACRGARTSRRYREGDTIGLLPGYDADSANDHVDVAIATGLGHARNVLCAASGDVVLAVGGASGTLSEIALAWTLGKPVACVGDAPGWAPTLARQDDRNDPGQRIEGPFEPEEAAAWAWRRVRSRRRDATADRAHPDAGRRKPEAPIDGADGRRTQARDR